MIRKVEHTGNKSKKIISYILTFDIYREKINDKSLFMSPDLIKINSGSVIKLITSYMKKDENKKHKQEAIDRLMKIVQKLLITQQYKNERFDVIMFR